jgi:hypothetical protein
MAPCCTKLNLWNPDTFDSSDLVKLNLFLAQCYFHFAERTQDFPTDDDKILFMISYLWGTAQQWFAPNLYDLNSIPSWNGNFPVFIQELTMNFGLHDLVGDAEDHIQLCCMKHGDRIATYIIEFNQLALLTQWGDPALQHQFYEGLPCQIKDDMVHHAYVNSIAGVKSVARLINTQYWKHEGEKEREWDRDRGSGDGSGAGNVPGTRGCSGKPSGRQGSRKKGSSNKAPDSTVATSGSKGSGKKAESSGAGASGKAADAPKAECKPYANKLDSHGKLKLEECERQKKLGLCMFCGGSGHTAEDC